MLMRHIAYIQACYPVVSDEYDAGGETPMTETTPTKSIRADANSQVAGTPKVSPQITWSDAGLPKLAQHLFSLMLRNLASDGFLFVDPNHPDPKDPQSFSLPGCIIAAPSSPANTPGIDQDYVYNWTRDAAITAIEIAAANLPAAAGTGVQSLIDYVNFAQTCQNNATPSLALASYTIRGLSRQWTEQTDGPALQILAFLMAYEQLDTPTRAVAVAVINKNLDYLLGTYQDQTFQEFSFKSGVGSAQFQRLKTVTMKAPNPTAQQPVWQYDITYTTSSFSSLFWRAKTSRS